MQIDRYYLPRGCLRQFSPALRFTEKSKRDWNEADRRFRIEYEG